VGERERKIFCFDSCLWSLPPGLRFSSVMIKPLPTWDVGTVGPDSVMKILWLWLEQFYFSSYNAQFCVGISPMSSIQPELMPVWDL
jgi:hypothetical protein